ncbi:MAG: CopG family transcriptional regulator [Blastocatellia bacterium]
MTNIQLSIEDTLVTKIDCVVNSLAMTHTDFFREALEVALRKYEISFLEKQHEESYRRHPVQPGEFDCWESEQVWEEPGTTDSL